MMKKYTTAMDMLALSVVMLALVLASCNKKQLDSGSNGSGGRSAAPC
jgi:hypothetical protein